MSETRLGFYMPRANYLKVMGPLVQYLVTARPREYRVVVLLPAWSTSKPQLRVDVSTFPVEWDGRIDVRRLESPSALVDAVRTGDIHALFSVQPALSDLDSDQTSQLRGASVAAGVKWVALPEGFSQAGYVIARTADLRANWDLVCQLGAHSMRYIDRHLAGMAPDVAADLRSRLAVTGYPEFDALSALDSDASIRRKYGLPLDRPVIVVATAARTVPLSINTWTARGLDARFRRDAGWSMRAAVAHAASLRHPFVAPYARYLSALRRFADRNGAVLVAKTRTKHHDVSQVERAFDYFIDDRTFFPFTTLELLKTASLYFGFYSNTTSEAVVCGVYALTALTLPPAAMQANPQWREFGKAMTWGREGLWGIPGVTELLWGTRPDAPRALDRFAASNLEDYQVDRQRQSEVLHDFFSYPGNSSARVVDALAAIH